MTVWLFGLQGRAATRAALLQLVFAETVPLIAHRVAHCVAQSATAEPWADLLQTVCGAMGSGPVQARTALFILEQLPDYAPEMMAGNALALLPVYSGALASQDLKVRISGLKASAAVLVALPSDKERAPFMPLVQPTLAALAAALQNGHEADAQEVMTSLVTVAQNAVDFFRADLPMVVDAMAAERGKATEGDGSKGQCQAFPADQQEELAPTQVCVCVWLSSSERTSA